jgi:hypothetical protein
MTLVDQLRLHKKVAEGWMSKISIIRGQNYFSIAGNINDPFAAGPVCKRNTA